MTETRLQNQELPPPAPRRSKGEKLFNWLVYGGLGGVATFLLTLYPAYKMRYKGGEAWIGRHLERLGIHGKIANQVATATSLSLGGHIMLLPIAYAEAHHTQIVDGLNKMTLDPTPVEAIKVKPKPTLSSIISGRLVAWAAVVSGFIAAIEFFPKSLSTFENEFAERFCRVIRKPMHVAGEETKAFRYGKIAALDVFATACAATLLYIGSHFFARKKLERAQHQAEAQGVQALLPLQKTGKETIIEAKDPVSFRSAFAARVQAARHEGAETTIQRI